jgi:hypothetical protein
VLTGAEPAPESDRQIICSRLFLAECRGGCDSYEVVGVLERLGQRLRQMPRQSSWLRRTNSADHAQIAFAVKPKAKPERP